MASFSNCITALLPTGQPEDAACVTPSTWASRSHRLAVNLEWRLTKDETLGPAPPLLASGAGGLHSTREI